MEANDGAVAQLLDLFGSEYSWNTATTFNHTCSQIIRLQKSIKERQVKEKTTSANIMRNAYHAPPNEYSSMIRTLEGQISQVSRRTSYIPEGMLKLANG